MRSPSLGRQIVALAVPAFLALVAEPLFLLADSAIVGHLGTPQLAGLGVASAVLLTAANLFVFLAYATTSFVARFLGAGDRRSALRAGLDGGWLAVALGVPVAVAVVAAAGPLCALFGASAAAIDQAVTYLRVSALGLPAMLLALAVTGALRGLQDTRTPLVVSLAGFGANLVLNLVFVLGLGWGIAGSAWGTVLAQTGMAVALIVVLIRLAAREGASIRPRWSGVRAAAGSGLPLLVRTIALRSILLATTGVAAGLGDVTLAAHQVAANIWTLQAFALDALAIAAQALTGKELGAGRAEAARRATTLTLTWGAGCGLVIGGVVAGLHGVLPPLFTADLAVQKALAAALIVIGLSGWLCGLVFVADGVLIGAGDGRWLAGAMVATVALSLPVVWAVHLATPSLIARGGPASMTALWLAFIAFMVIRWAFLWHRLRSDRWMVLGVAR